MPKSHHHHPEHPAKLPHAPEQVEEPQRVQEQPSPQPPSQSGGGCLLRLLWMFGGNLALAMLAIFIARHKGSLLSGADPAYWLVAAGLVAIRWVDIAKLGGLTAQGEPATPAHWRRYTLILLAICAVVWIGAHVISHQ